MDVPHRGLEHAVFSNLTYVSQDTLGVCRFSGAHMFQMARVIKNTTHSLNFVERWLWCCINETSVDFF